MFGTQNVIKKGIQEERKQPGQTRSIVRNSEQILGGNLGRCQNLLYTLDAKQSATSGLKSQVFAAALVLRTMIDSELSPKLIIAAKFIRSRALKMTKDTVEWLNRRGATVQVPTACINGASGPIISPANGPSLVATAQIGQNKSEPTSNRPNLP